MKKIAASMVAALFAWAAFAQADAPASRGMSLQDCFAAALTNNFDLRVESINPQISELNIRAAYGGYDPVFNLRGERVHRENGGYVNSDNQLILPTESDEDVFTSSLSGGTPWGMTYELAGSLSENNGDKWTSNFRTNYTSSSGSLILKGTQPLLKNFWIDDNRLQIQVARAQLKFAEQALRAQLIKTLTDVENAYYELIYARENVNVQRDALVLAQTQLSQDRQRVEVGTIAPLDVQQDEAQVAQRRADLISAENSLSLSQNTLKNLLTDSYVKWHAVDIDPTDKMEPVRQSFDVQDSWGKGMVSRPDLIQAKVNVEKQGIQVKFDRNQLFPQLDLIGSYGFTGDGRQYRDSYEQVNDGSRPYYSYGGQLSIPLSSTSNRNRLKASKATEKQLLLRLKQAEQNILVEIDNAVKQVRSSWESVDATKQARIYAEAALSAEQKKYSVGKSTTFTVLQLQNNLTSARSQEIRALTDYNKALAALAAAEGTTLQRRNLEIKPK